jgi:hypothetical protein
MRVKRIGVAQRLVGNHYPVLAATFNCGVGFQFNVALSDQFLCPLSNQAAAGDEE